MASGAASDYLEGKIIDHVFKAATYTVPTNIYIALCKSTIDDADTGSTLPGEVTGGGYERTLCNSWSAASGGTISNENQITFPEATADWGYITDIALCDAQADGNVLTYGKLYLYKSILDGDGAIFEAGSIQVSLGEETEPNYVLIKGALEATSSVIGYVAGYVYAASPALVDVQAAIASASVGDTVIVPAGSVNDNGTLSITKGIILKGAGSTSTIINRSTTGRVFDVNLPSDSYLRISGFGFVFPTNSPSAYTTAIFIRGSVPLTKIRIDHNAFTKGNGTVWIAGQVYGVADHNSFTNISTNYHTGAGDAEWLKGTILAGTSEAFFWEDNTILVDNGSESKSPDAVVYIQEGASVVVRHNSFDASAFSSSTWGWLTILNTHGNQGYYPAGSVRRGSPICEVYNNTVATYGAANLFGSRGGSMLVHDNTITSGPAYFRFSMFSEEEAWQSLMFSPLRTAWPAQDQIFNTFYWNNTNNGSPCTPVIESGSETFIQENRDFFNHAPQSSGGYEYFTGSRKGGSQTAPTESDTGSMEWSASGANAYYPYTPYTYPHPYQSDPILGD